MIMDVKTMSEVELKEAIKKVMQDNFGLNEITDEADFIKDLKLDSLTRMELLLKLEDEFGVRVEDNDAQAMLSINATASILKKIAE